MEFLWIGFSLGLVGSIHCVGMCGPLYATTQSYSNKIVTNGLQYSMGRLLSYLILASIISSIGYALSLTLIQQRISIITGVILLLIIAIGENKIFSFLPFSLLSNFINRNFGKVINSKSNSKYFVGGMLNGILPCGMSLMAIVSSLSLGSTSKGLLFVLFFGLGTMPGMLAFGYLFNKSLKGRINKLLPVLTVLTGLLLIFRGLGLGIPYLSPDIEINHLSNNTAIHCK